MSDEANPILVRQTRGPRVETMHRAAFAMVRGDEVIHSAGDIDAPAFMRSGAKFFQAIPCVLSGAPERFHLGDRALALACGSHNAEPEHVAIARRMLAAAGLSESDLACGPHPPMHAPTAGRMVAEQMKPTRIHNNCSGKHAAMILAAIARGESPKGYTDPGHPLQQEIARVLRVFSGAAESELELAVDGCGAPTFILPLRRSARAFARFGCSDGGLDGALAAAAARLCDAVTRQPDMVAGDGRLCSAIARTTGGRILTKVGADGFYGATVRDRGIGLALHIDDGATPIAERLLVELLRRADFLTESEVADLAAWATPVRRNCAGDPVGSFDFDLPVLAV